MRCTIIFTLHRILCYWTQQNVAQTKGPLQKQIISWWHSVRGSIHCDDTSCSTSRYIRANYQHFREGVLQWISLFFVTYAKTLPTAYSKHFVVLLTLQMIQVQLCWVVCLLTPKHVEQFPGKINCVTLHLVGYTSILEYYYDARNHDR